MAYDDPESKYIRRGQVCAALNISYNTLAVRIKQGRIADGFHLGGEANSWKLWSRDYIESLIGNN